MTQPLVQPLMNLIAITPEYFYPDEPRAIARALAGGFSRVHIRKPGSTPEQIERLISEIPQSLRQHISLHDHTGLAAPYGIGGVHLNSRFPDVPGGFNGIVSRSVHTPDEARTASGHYLLLSPVFPSISKPGYVSTFTFAEMASVASPRVYALGGVTRSNLDLLRQAGFGGAAMLSDAWRTPLDMQAFRLQFITHPTAGHSVVEGAELALRGGCRWVQLRHKEADTDTLIHEGRTIARLCNACNATFIIDDHVDLVHTVGAHGVHLGQNDMPVAQARRILGPSKIIGATANTFETLRNAAAEGADYVGIGPFRFTTTKKNLSPVLGIGGYIDIMRQCADHNIRIPAVAIGGITQSDIPAIMQTGVEGIALSSTILNDASPEAATRRIIRTTNNSLNTI